MFKVPQVLIDCIEKYERPLADDKKLSQKQIELIGDLMSACYGIGFVMACCNDDVISGDSALATLREENFEFPAWEMIKVGQERETELVVEIISQTIFN